MSLQDCLNLLVSSCTGTVINDHQNPAQNLACALPYQTIIITLVTCLLTNSTVIIIKILLLLNIYNFVHWVKFTSFLCHHLSILTFLNENPSVVVFSIMYQLCLFSVTLLSRLNKILFFLYFYLSVN